MRGLGGSLLYFTDPAGKLKNIWDVDFTPLKVGQGGVGLTKVDHISQSMHYEDMLSWILFYTSLFDVQKTPQVDITDPGGIVRSQVVETKDGTLRIALNASQSQRTQSSRFLNEYFGSGVQHIAFATDDIVATAKRLKANGVETLAIPENYYDDLDARLGLPAEQLALFKSQQHSLRQGQHRRIFPALYQELQGPVLPRDRRAPPVQGIWRA